MRKSTLPQDVMDLLWAQGLAGKRVYVPKQKSQTLIETGTPGVLEMIETVYERDPRVLECEVLPYEAYSRTLAKETLSRALNVDTIASRFHLKTRTAALVVSKARKIWRDWFLSQEQPRLGQLRAMAQEQGIDPIALLFGYKEIRKRLRFHQPITTEDYTWQGKIPVVIIQKVYDLARASVESRPWKDTGG